MNRGSAMKSRGLQAGTLAAVVVAAGVSASAARAQSLDIGARSAFCRLATFWSR
jgi:hypothetical protein